MPKSAYEVALERLKQEGLDASLPKLTPAQKKKLAEVTRQHQAKIAERKILTEQGIAEAIAAGDLEAAQKLRDELPGELASLREKMERERQRILKRASKPKPRE
jgi:hypothetical protein